MPIAPGAEPHMVALANQADAANRPRWIIAFAAFVAIACAVVAAAGTMRLVSAKAQFASAEAQLRTADQLTNQILTTRADKPSLEKLYPDAGLMFVQVEQTVRTTWGVQGQDYKTFATIKDLQRDNLSIPGLGKANVACTIRNQPIEKILEFTETLLGMESMRHAFVSTFELAPSAGGWNAEIEFRRYEVR